MVKSTETAIRSLVKLDPSISEGQLKAALAAFAGKGIAERIDAEPLPVTLSRGDVAKLLHKSTKAIDRYCQLGLLTRFYPVSPDGKRFARSIGITESSYRAFVAAGSAGKEVEI